MLCSHGPAEAGQNPNDRGFRAPAAVQFLTSCSLSSGYGGVDRPGVEPSRLVLIRLFQQATVLHTFHP